jgi:hypothetical protein
MKPKLKPPGSKRLKLKCDAPLSNVAFKFNLRCYTKADVSENGGLITVATTCHQTTSGYNSLSNGREEYITPATSSSDIGTRAWCFLIIHKEASLSFFPATASTTC